MIWLFVFCTILALAAVAAVLVRRSLEREFSDLTCHLCEIKRAVSGTPDVRANQAHDRNGVTLKSHAIPARPNPARASVPVRNVAHER
jgi:hypothetical protein